MATYYVRTDGNDTNAGTGPATNQAWQTITKAIGATGIAPGDTLYIAPGIYRGIFTAGFTNPANESQRITIAGDPTASQFTGVNTGPVIITNYNSDNATPISGDIFTLNKSFVTLQDLVIYGWLATTSNYAINATVSALRIIRCLLGQPNSNVQKILASIIVNAGAIGLTLNRSVVINGRVAFGGATHSGQWDSQSVVSDNIFINGNSNSLEGCLSVVSITSGQFGGVKIVNNFMQGLFGVRFNSALSTTYPSVIQNCNIEASVTGILSDVSNTSAVLQTYNILNAPTSVTNISSSATSKLNVFNPINASISKIQGWGDYPFLSPLALSQTAINAGINTNSPVTDIYGTTWLAPSTPTIGSVEFQSYTPTGSYLPTERNASTITIAPGSTSQSIELYLGVTGLAFNTSGLSAYYIRNRSAPVPITLVTQTATGAWTSGGFAEISSSLTPGVYRLDLPNASVAAGADDVTVVVRGASGTNGAVMTIKLSSGGLTAAQTASAILDAVGASYVTAGSIGYAIQNSNVASISGSTAAADELEGALLHNGTDYISAQLIAGGGGGAGDVGGNIINLNEDPEVVVQTSAWVGDWHTYVLRLVDSNGTPYDITNDTLAVTFTNVATGNAYAFGGGSATITKQMNGQGILSILNPAAYPTAAVIRLTVSATIGSDVRRFGPLEIEVLAP